jgi:hypothetical protein
MTPWWQDRRIVIAAAAVLVLGAGLFWLLRPAPEADVVSVPTPPPAVEREKLRAYEIFFPGADGRLHAETHELASSREPADNVARLVETLLAGPRGEQLWAPLPAGVSLGRTYLMADDEDAGDVTVILDLVTADGARPSTGSMNETLMLYSLVNTVLLNVKEADRMVLLWNGRQALRRPRRHHAAARRGGRPHRPPLIG